MNRGCVLAFGFGLAFWALMLVLLCKSYRPYPQRSFDPHKGLMVRESGAALFQGGNR